MACEQVLVTDHDFGQLWGQKVAQPVGPFQLGDLLCDPGFEFGVPLCQFVGLSPDGGVIALDPRQRRHSGEQLALVERFRDEVVGARLEGGQPLFSSAGGDHHDGKEFRCGIGSYSPADFVAVHLRHQDVEQDDVDVFGLEQRQRFRA